MPILKCKWCGTEFVSRNWRQLYCSKNCKRLAQQRRTQMRYAVTCRYCGKTVEKSKAHSTFYCSEHCAKNAAAEMRLLQSFHPTMSEEEIRMWYREAKNKKKQITILADMNLCETEVMRQYLEAHGILEEAM